MAADEKMEHKMILFLVLLSLPLLTVLLIRYVSPSAVRTTSATGQTDERIVILKQGCCLGLPLGAFFMVQNLFGNVIPLPAAAEPIVDRVFAPFILSIALLALFSSGYRASRLTGRLRAASLAGSLTGVFVFFLFGLSFVIIDMAFFDVVRQQPEKILNFAQSGYADMRAYLFESTVRGATVMTLVGAASGAILGSVGGLVGNRRFLQRRMV